MAEEPAKENTIVRDQLARQRTELANERTLLAYVRTVFMLMVAGATVLKFFGDERVLAIGGFAMIVLGLVIGVIGGTRFVRMARAIRHASRNHGASSSGATPAPSIIATPAQPSSPGPGRRIG
jgi:putative membrane protein